MCVSSVAEFSKEQNKRSTSTVYHKHYCGRTFFSRFTVKLIYHNIIIHEGVVNFEFNFTFHNILIYNRVTLNNRVACCVDFIREYWQPVEPSCKEFRKIFVFKIPKAS